jgi:hypothetical protein
MSHNLQYRLAMQSDGNLVVYGNGRAVTATRTPGHPGAYLAVQTDGNAVLYDATGKPLWNTATKGTGAQLAMQDNGDLVLRLSGQWAWSNGAPGSDKLTPGGVLTAGQTLHSPAGTSVLSMQYDGNLVVYRYGKARWSTRTDGNYGARAVMQGDGNFVVYDGAGRPLWNSATNGTGANRLVMQTDGNLVLYTPRRPVWCTYTNR